MRRRAADIIVAGAAWIGVTLGGTPAALATCTVQYNDATEAVGDYFGCCDPVNGLRTSGACVDETQPCRAGTCDMAGNCNPNADVTNGTNCPDPNDPCRYGQCYGGLCKGTGNSSDENKVAFCSGDTNPCTVDCQRDPNYYLGHVCYTDRASRPDISENTWYPGSIQSCGNPNGSTCTMGECTGCTFANGVYDCLGAEVCDTSGGATHTCSGSINECEYFQCSVVQGVPQCAKLPKTGDVPCNQANDTADDCKLFRCVVTANGHGDCRNLGDVLESDSCDMDTSTPCTRGQCNASKQCVQVTGLATGTPCPGPGDGNACTVDTCYQNPSDPGDSNCSQHTAGNAGAPCAPDSNACTNEVCGNGAQLGTCTHPAKPDMTPCTIGYQCVTSAACESGQCAVQTCASTGKCSTCYGAPNCVNDPDDYCGCQ